MVLEFTLTSAENQKISVGGGISKAFQHVIPVGLTAKADLNDPSTWVFYYQLPSGSITKIRRHGVRLIPLKWETPESYWTEPEQFALQRILIQDLGLSRQVSIKLARSRRTTLLRIEEHVQGIIKSLWLAYPFLFEKHSDDFKIVKSIIRKEFKIGAYNLQTLSSNWKEWTNWFKHTTARTVTIGATPQLSRYNHLRALNKLNFINEILNDDGVLTKSQLNRIAVMCSRRQMPYMGKETQNKSMMGLKAVVCEDDKPGRAHIMKMHLVARRIGAICLKLRRLGTIPDDAAHYSVTNSGERDNSLSKGAQAKATFDGLTKVLSEVQDKDWVEMTPWGEVHHRKGLAVHTYLFKAEEEIVGL